MALKIGLMGFVITLIIALPLGILIYRYSQKKINSFDYDLSKDGWIKWETEEQWDAWDFTGEKTLQNEEAENHEVVKDIKGEPDSQENI